MTYAIKFYPTIENVKTDEVLFCLKISKKEFDKLAVKKGIMIYVASQIK